MLGAFFKPVSSPKSSETAAPDKSDIELFGCSILAENKDSTKRKRKKYNEEELKSKFENTHTMNESLASM